MGTLAFELPVATIVAVQRVAEQLEQTFRAAHAMTGGQWPAACCVEASVALAERLEKWVPDAGAVYVWGDIAVDGVAQGHAWVELRDRTIVDLTLGQYTGAAPLAIIPPGHEFADYYEPRRRGLGKDAAWVVEAGDT